MKNVNIIFKTNEEGQLVESVITGEEKEVRSALGYLIFKYAKANDLSWPNIALSIYGDLVEIPTEDMIKGDLRMAELEARFAAGEK